MGTSSFSHYIEGSDKKAVLDKLHDLHEESRYEDGNKYDQGSWGGVYIDKQCFVNQSPVRYDDLDSDAEMSKVKGKGDCRIVPVLAPKGYGGDQIIDMKGTKISYPTTVTAEEVDLLRSPRYIMSGSAGSALLTELRDSIIEAVDGHRLEIVRQRADGRERGITQYKEWTEEIDFDASEWNMYGVRAHLTNVRSVKRTSGKRVTKYVVKTEDRYFNKVVSVNHGTFDTEKGARDFIAENVDKIEGNPEVYGMVMREDGAPLAQVESNEESIITVDINISKRESDSELVPGFLVFAKSAT